VAIEFLRSRLMANATWGSIAYTQDGVLPLMQIAAFAGIWGIVFLMAWSAATVEAAWRHGFAAPAARGPLFACAAVFLLAVIAGTIRAAAAPTDRPVMRVATLNRPADLFVPGEMTRITEGRIEPADRPSIDAKLIKLHDWFLDGSRREARAGARLVVWPEQNLLVFSEHEASFCSIRILTTSCRSISRAGCSFTMRRSHCFRSPPWPNPRWSRERRASRRDSAALRCSCSP
jgi:apolipoprotein N-acyltransferase